LFSIFGWDAWRQCSAALERERPADAAPGSTALFLSASSIGSRRPDGRMSTRAISQLCEQIGRWRDAEQPDPARHVSPLRPHDLRHFRVPVRGRGRQLTFELQRRLGHQSRRYIDRYTHPPEEIAAGYIEDL
jgi:integrase